MSLLIVFVKGCSLIPLVGAVELAVRYPDSWGAAGAACVLCLGSAFIRGLADELKKEEKKT